MCPADIRPTPGQFQTRNVTTPQAPHPVARSNTPILDDAIVYYIMLLLITLKHRPGVFQGHLLMGNSNSLALPRPLHLTDPRSPVTLNKGLLEYTLYAVAYYLGIPSPGA